MTAVPPESLDRSPVSSVASPLGGTLLAFVDRVLNRLVHDSTAAADLLERLDGKSFAIHVEGLGVDVVLHATGAGIRVGTTPAGATASLRATPFDLLRLANAERGAGGVKSTRAEIRGDLQTAELFADLLRLARPDLEGELSRFVGDVPAHALGALAAGARAWLTRASTAVRMNTAEFLQEESRALPAPLEAQAFYRDVERLRDDVERAAARLARLTRGA